MPEPKDISCKQLSRFFARCEDHYPMSDRYIAEASGVAGVTVESAYSAAEAAGDYRRTCGAVRKFFET